MLLVCLYKRYLNYRTNCPRVTRVHFYTLSINIVQRIRSLKLSEWANERTQTMANESFTRIQTKLSYYEATVGYLQLNTEISLARLLIDTHSQDGKTKTCTWLRTRGSAALSRTRCPVSSVDRWACWRTFAAPVWRATLPLVALIRRRSGRCPWRPAHHRNAARCVPSCSR